MPASLAIGDFSRATHLNIKTLRHYHRIGLLEPAHVDPDTGHRRYGTDQIPTAQVIKRFRSLDMPLEEIHAVITTPDLAGRPEGESGRPGRRHLRQRAVLPRPRSGHHLRALQ
jgi:DNA-binding transcriptional MerR regulator